MVAEDVLDQSGVDVGQSAAAELLRPGHPDPAGLPEGAGHLARVAVGEHSLPTPLGIVEQRRAKGLGECCSLLPKRELHLCRPEIHGPRS